MMLMDRKELKKGNCWGAGRAGEKVMKDDDETMTLKTSEIRCAEKRTWKRGWAGTKYPWSRFRSLVGTVTRRS